jgi:phage terminase large subunit
MCHLSMAEQVLVIPYKPNKCQMSLHRNMKRYNVVVWHRGLGKTYSVLQELVKQAVSCDNNGLFIYIAPTKTQAKIVAWSDLKEILKVIPDLKIREDELSVTFPDTGAIIRLEGADEPDRLRGIHPRFVVLDEVGQMKRDTWYEVILPSVQRHHGRVIFIGTPKGSNLFNEIYDTANEIIDSGDHNWYTDYQDVYSAGHYNAEEIKGIKAPMPAAKFNQEYLLHWDAIFTGAYYADLLCDESLGIITDVPYNPMYPVITGWDLGIKDPTCIWFAQKISGKYNFIDYYESTDKDIFAIVNMLQRKPYRYSYHIIPHDATARSYLDLKTTRLSILQAAFGHECVKQTKKPANNQAVLEGISIAHTNLYISRIDRKKCSVGLEHLKTYRSEVDRLTGEATDVPSHDSSDAADALRTFFTGVKNYDDGSFSGVSSNFRREAETAYDYFGW